MQDNVNGLKVGLATS